MDPALLGSLTEQPIIEKPTSDEEETSAKWKWSFSGITQELRRRHGLRKVSGVPGVRQSILAILKTSCETFLCQLLSPRLIVWWSDPGLNALLIFIPLSVRIFYPHRVDRGL